MFLKFHELHQIANRFVSLEIGHLHVVVIQLVHYFPVISIANSDYDNA